MLFESLVAIKDIVGLKGKLSFLVSYPLFLISHRKLNFFPSFKIRLNGKFFLTRSRTSDYWHVISSYEKKVTDYMINKKGNIFLDVGAHIGRYSILCSNNFKKVYSFEPVFSTFLSLKKNIKLNNLSNVIPLNLALNNKEGDFNIGLDLENLGASSLLKKTDNEVKVKATTLDKFLRKYNISVSDLSLIKIDVEGAEKNVLEGFKKLRDCDCDIIIELFNIKNNEVVKILENNNYILKEDLGNSTYLFVKNSKYKPKNKTKKVSWMSNSRR